ncbi:hypothetical protein L873DRAFT_1650966, partial [Choiromyces venosus 120613-1]
ESSLQENLIKYMYNTVGNRFWIYSDASYRLEEGILSSYHTYRYIGSLNNSQEIFNTNIVRQCIIIESCFGKLVSLFPLINYSKKLKLGLSPISFCIFIVVLLKTTHTCYYGSETVIYFER